MPSDDRDIHRLPDLIDIGQITRTHGIHGDVCVRPLTDKPDRFKLLQRVFLNRDGEPNPFNIESVKIAGRFVLLHVHGIDSIEQAQQWRNAYVQIPREDCVPLPQGQYYYFEVMNLTVLTTAGEKIGHIEDIQSYPAHDIYVVRNDDREYLIPAVPEIIKKIDILQGTMVIQAIEGLLD